MTLKECPQIKCSFHKSNGMPEWCPVCVECGSPSNVYEDDTCVECWGCIKDEGKLRSGFPDLSKIGQKQKKKQEEKEEEKQTETKCEQEPMVIER